MAAVTAAADRLTKAELVFAIRRRGLEVQEGATLQELRECYRAWALKS